MLTSRPSLNIIGFLILTMFSYLMLCYWPVISAVIVDSVTTYYTFDIYIPDRMIRRDVYELMREISERILINIKDIKINPVELFETETRIYRTWVLMLDNVFEQRVNGTIALLPNLGRLLITLIFVGSFLLQPLQRPISALWLRIIESDKPVFTLLFGGAATITKTIQEITKNL